MINSGSYIVRVANYTFHLSVQQGKAFDCQQVLYLGGYRKGCVEVILCKSKDIDPRFSFLAPHIAKMPKVEYDNRCSVNDGGLEKGKGTKTMIRTMIELVRKYYLHITHIEVDDASYFECARGVTVSLPHMTVVASGKTWYEKHFYAVLRDPVLYTRYREQIQEEFLSPKNVSFENVFQHVLVDHRVANLVQKLKDFYDQDQPLTHTFQSALNRLGKDDYCRTVSPWIDQFVNSKLGAINLNSIWTIDMKTFTQTLTSMTVEPSTKPFEYDKQLGGRGGGNRRNNGFTWEDVLL